MIGELYSTEVEQKADSNTRGVKIILGVASILQFVSLCAVLAAMLMQKMFQEQMLHITNKDLFAVPYAALINTGLILILYVVVFGVVMGTGEENSRTKTTITLICLVVMRILCGCVGIVENMVIARKGAEMLGLHSVVESYASMWSSPFVLVAFVLFCFGMGRYYDCQDR